MLHIAPAPPAAALDQLWFTRCPVPTASGIAYTLGWLDEAFVAHGIRVDALQDTGRPELRRHHFDHGLPNLIREGGNIPALAARAGGAPTRLIGLTWIEERQSILVRPGSAIATPADLRGTRIGIPAHATRAPRAVDHSGSVHRGMSLIGIRGALAAGGLGFDDVELVEVATRRPIADPTDLVDRSDARWPLDALADGRVDALYCKGADAVDAARRLGLVVGIDLDALPDRRFRANNGTPRPITVHQSLLDDHFDVVVRFLTQTLRAADWARDHLTELRAVLQHETGSSAEAAIDAYRGNFHTRLHPDLSDERVALLAHQKRALWLHGFIGRDFDLDDWIDPRPLAAAHALLRAEHPDSTLEETAR